MNTQRAQEIVESPDMVDVSNFSDNTGKKLQEAIEKLTKQIGRDKLKGFVLDLPATQPSKKHPKDRVFNL